MKEEKKEDNESIVYGILKNNLKIISITKLPFIIGRKEKCDLIINNPSISKRHALIQFEEDEEENTNIQKSKEIILIDNSLNGTYVNGTKISNGKKILLETGDKISFGNDKSIFIFELMNYDHDRTIIYPNLLSMNKIETNPISLVNEDYYQKSEINHFNTIKTKNSENFYDNNSDENNRINKKEENKNSRSSLNEEKKNLKNDNIENEEKIEEKEKNIKDENEKVIETENNKTINNYYNNIEQIFLLKQEIFELKKENENLKTEINTLKETINNFNNINNKINNNHENSFKNINTETSNSLNNSNINLLAEDLRELGLFRRIKEALVPNLSELNFEELSLKFDKIIIEYKNKYNIAEILLNMEKEFNNEISRFNNIISLQQEQKRDTLNKINYLLNKENNLEINNSYSKANKYLMEQLNELISDKEINIKLISQLKGDIIKLKTEINLYKANNNKNNQLKNNLKNTKIIKSNIVKNEINDKLLSEYHMKNYIDYNIDKYSIGYNKYKKSYSDINQEINNQQYKNDFKEIRNYNNYEENYLLNEKNDDNKSQLLDDYQRINILAQNSQDNLKYQEIIKQKELIVNGIK